MPFFLSWCLRLIAGDVVPAADHLLLVVRCTPWLRRASVEWGAVGIPAAASRSGGGTARDGHDRVGQCGAGWGARGEMAAVAMQSGVGGRPHDAEKHATDEQVGKYF
jgi:hypothetical protein